MDIVTLGAALNGSAEYVNSHFKGGSNIQIVDNPDGTQTINASGEVSSEDTVARAEIADIKDGTTLDSFGDVETALADKVDKETEKGLSTNDYTTAEKTKLAGIEAQANKTTVDDALSGSSTNPVQNKVVKSALDSKANISDIPTVPITAIQKNGTDITPVSGTVNIAVPTQASDINAATATQGGKADTAIQGVKVNSSTVNPDSNKVVSITVPTTAADVSALPDTTKYAAALSLTINSSTYVVTGQLKDQNGDNLGTAQTIDLPLESVVVGGSYNSQTKKVVLTLQNGNTIEFSVADLVSGLQTELSASNKLNPAYINYDSTHRAVSDTEKSTWNGKQDALTTSQLAAANSGIDSAKVEQIETNKTNILLIADQSTQYNVFDFANAELLDIYHITATKTDTSLSVTSTGNWSRVQMPVTLKAGTYQFQCKITNYNAERNSATKITIQTAASGGTVLGTAWFNRNQTTTCSFTISSDSTIYICVHANWSDASYTNTYTASEFMITPKSLYDAGFTDYQPYALSNAELTAAEKQNENNILSLEQMNGAKNKFNYDAWKNCGVFQGTKTVNGNSFTLVASGEDCFTYYENNEPRQYPINARIPCNAGDKVVLTWEYTPLSSQSDDRVGIFANGSTSTGFFALVSASNKKLEFTAPTGTTYLSIRFGVLTSGNSATYGNIQIQSKASYDAGFTDYQPYAMSNAELTAAIQAIQAQLANQ